MSDLLSHVLKKYNILMAMRPHATVRRLLVHPNHKRSMDEASGLVYKIPCNDCSKLYNGKHMQNM